jgi:dTDP-4-dehydrorhamnose reductase
MKKVLVTGANGQLGKTFKALSGKITSLKWVFEEKKGLNIADFEETDRKIAQIAPDVVINCAAYTAVDQAESDREKAYEINSKAVENLARICQERSVFLVHYSTDYVYHNELNRPLRETDPCNPKGVYASSKWAGEMSALRLCKSTAVLRTSWVYSPYGKNFVKTMLELSEKMDEISVVEDQIGAPTNTEDLARATVEIIREYFNGDADSVTGVFNYSNSGVASWYDFAVAVFDLAGRDVKVKPIPTKAFPRPAPRPFFSVMCTEKARAIPSVKTPHWSQSLRKCLIELGEIAESQTN